MSGSESGLYAVNVSNMVRLLAKSYITLIKKGIPFRTFPSVMLWGPPGIGKSQGIREVASVIESGTGKKVVITDVRLLLFNPVDLRGIPTANEDKTLAVWLKPKIFQMDESDSVVNILLLDEISAAPPSVQAAAYQITLDRMVGEHKLPENCIVIAAGNRITDKSVAYAMPKALANRLCHFEIMGDPGSWHKWAVRNGIHEYVMGYLEYNSSALMKSENSGNNLAFATPRSWEMVSNILNNVSSNLNDVFPMVAGCIGYHSADIFRTWTELYAGLPDAEAIFDGENVAVPKEKEQLIALRAVMVSRARKHKSLGELNNSIDYACRLPFSFRKKLLSDYSMIPGVYELIKNNPVYLDAQKETNT